MGRIDRSGSRYSREDRQIATDSLAQVGLESLARRPFAQLSGGQRQRVLIARALACQVDLLILDEPTANVDSSAESQLHELLERLSKVQTLLMVTHDLGFVYDMTGKVICVNRTVDTHPTSELSGQSFENLYQHSLRLVHHSRSLKHGKSDRREDRP